MLGLPLSMDGLINVAVHATPTKELRWLLSTFVGIIMCKIVYDLTGVVSSLFFDGYAKLNKRDKLEWNNRGFSTFHALVAATASLYLLITLGLYDGDSEDELIINRKSASTEFILGVSIGYFLSDLAMIIYYFPALGGIEYVLHHGLSIFSVIQTLLTGQAQIYILMVLFTESTTPFINLRWYLDIAGQKKSKLYLANGLTLVFGWLYEHFNVGQGLLVICKNIMCLLKHPLQQAKDKKEKEKDQGCKDPLVYLPFLPYVHPFSSG